MATPIDWDAVDAEFEAALKKEQLINEQIRQERKEVKTVEELIEDAKKVNKIIEKNNFNTKIISPKKSDED